MRCVEESRRANGVSRPVSKSRLLVKKCAEHELFENKYHGILYETSEFSRCNARDQQKQHH